MKLKHYPASAFLSDETFERLLRVTETDALFICDIRFHYRRHWRVRLIRALRTPMYRRNEQRTRKTITALERRRRD